jgi:hypothetical protein
MASSSKCELQLSRGRNLRQPRVTFRWSFPGTYVIITLAHTVRLISMHAAHAFNRFYRFFNHIQVVQVRAKASKKQMVFVELTVTPLCNDTSRSAVSPPHST